MSKYHDDQTFASDPGAVSFARWRFRRLEPAAMGFRGWLWRTFGHGSQFEAMLAEHLDCGDSRAALVVSLDPLLVAAYTDELDCVVMLRFPPWLAAEHRLYVGAPLLTVNTYVRSTRLASDLRPGPRQFHRYSNFFPVIADFFSDDAPRIAQRKATIPAEEWQTCQVMAGEHLHAFRGRWRNGSPLHSVNPG